MGTLLANVAGSVTDGLSLMRFADKRQWGPDEFEQVRALERALDSAKRDFQELSALLNGQTYYTGDTTSEFSLGHLGLTEAQAEEGLVET